MYLINHARINKRSDPEEKAKPFFPLSETKKLHNILKRYPSSFFAEAFSSLIIFFSARTRCLSPHFNNYWFKLSYHHHSLALISNNLRLGQHVIVFLITLLVVIRFIVFQTVLHCFFGLTLLSSSNNLTSFPLLDSKQIVIHRKYFLHFVNGDWV